MNKKKSQITLFIILGLVIVFAVVFLLYARNISLFFQPSKVIPENVKPIENLIEHCLESEAINPINHMMLHAGYTETDLKFLSNEYFPDLKIPYKLPENIEKIQQSLKNEIIINLKDCIDFTKFEQFNIIEKDVPKLTVKINDEDVTLSLKYPLEVINKQNNKVTKLLDFKKVIQTKLRKLYELAFEIMKIEDQGIKRIDPMSETGEKRTVHFLEEMTIDIIASNNPETFPYYGTEITTKSRKWTIEQLKKDLKERLIDNLDCITYKGTASEDFLDSCEYADYYLTRFSIPVTDNIKYKNTIVTTSHTFLPEWKFTEFSVSPSKGDTVTSIELPIKLIPIKYYNHKYTIRYPVLFKLIEEEDIFNFATEVIIIDNNPNRIFEFTYHIPLIDSEDFCKEKEIPLTIEAEDKVTNILLKDVEIKYHCVGFECDLGKIKQEMLTENVPDYTKEIELKTNVPFCSNGLIIANKDNYLEKRKFILKDKTYSQAKSGENVFIDMIPLKKMDYEFKIIDSSTDLSLRDLQNDESVMLTLLNKEENYDQTIYYSSELKDEKIEFMLGNYKYDINIILTKEKNEEQKIIGNFKLNDWKPDYYDLKDKKKITFYIPAKSELIDLADEDLFEFLEQAEEESKLESYKPRIT